MLLSASELGPKQSDNVISFVYIMIYLITGSLPWIDEKEDTATSIKMDDVLIESLLGDLWRWGGPLS